MSIKRLRICLFCHQVGVTETFETGNALRRHVASRHPRTKEQKKADNLKLRVYRREVLLAAARLGISTPEPEYQARPKGVKSVYRRYTKPRSM